MIESQEKRSLFQSGWFNTLARFMALVAVFSFFALMVEGGKFYTPRNLENILRQSAVYATAALGMTMVIISAGIDLSIGSIIALGVVALAWVLNFNVAAAGATAQTLLEAHPFAAPLLAIAAALLLTTLAGMLNGAMIVRLRLVPFIVTLGTMGIYRGLAKGIASDKDIYAPESWINTLMDPTLTSPNAARRIMVFPPGVWILIVAAGVAALLLRYTRAGRHMFAIGSNEETARLCGVPVGRTKLIIYALAGFFAGLAALMQYSFISGIGQPTTAQSYELFVIASVVIGGGSLNGGEGSILGSIIGALMITILSMGTQQMGWPKWVQEMVIGAIIIIAVSIDQLRHRKSQ